MPFCLRIGGAARTVRLGGTAELSTPNGILMSKTDLPAAPRAISAGTTDCLRATRCRQRFLTVSSQQRYTVQVRGVLRSGDPAGNSSSNLSGAAGQPVLGRFARLRSVIAPSTLLPSMLGRLSARRPYIAQELDRTQEPPRLCC